MPDHVGEVARLAPMLQLILAFAGAHASQDMSLTLPWQMMKACKWPMIAVTAHAVQSSTARHFPAHAKHAAPKDATCRLAISLEPLVSVKACVW